MNEPHQDQPERPNVSVLLDQSPDELEAPAPLQPKLRRTPQLAVALVLILGAGLLWSASRDTAGRGEEALPASEPSETFDEEAANPILELTDDQIERAPMGDFLNTPVRQGDRWIALRRSQTGSRLVESTDGLKWSTIDGELARSNLFGIDWVDGTWRTMVNSAALNEQRFTLLTQASADALEWDRLPSAEPHSASGNQPTNADLRFGNSVVVGDRPFRPEIPPAPLVELLSGYVSPTLADTTCSIRRAPGTDESFDLRSCDGDTIGRIAPDNQRQLNTLSTVTFLLQFETVVLAQVDGRPLEEIVLAPGEQVASVQATPTGFIAVVIGALDVFDPERSVLLDPVGKLIRWSPELGIEEVTGGVAGQIDLTDWFDNRLEVGPDGAAVLASASVVLSSPAPYSNWSLVHTAPDISTAETMYLGPDGSGLLAKDRLGQMWFGRVGEPWVRAPQLDDGVPRGVLLSTDEHFIGIIEFDSFVAQLARVPLAAEDTPDPS